MKKTVFLILAVLVPLACVTAPPLGAPEIDELMERWTTGLREENIDVLMSTYWPDAELVLVQPDGKEQHFNGNDQIERFQLEGFQQPGSFRDLNFSKPEGEIRGNSATYHIYVEAPGMHLVNNFELIRRDGQWRIIHQVIEAPPPEHAEGPEIRVVSPLQAWADYDGNGMLEGSELEEMLGAVERLFREEHPVDNPLDEIFDLEKDGHFDGADLGRARWVLVIDHFRRLYDHDHDLAVMYDLNDDGAVNVNEAWTFFDLIVENEQGLNVPHENRCPADRRLDQNRDSFVDQGEIEAFTYKLLHTIASFPFEPEELELMVRDKHQLFEWVDANHDGDISGTEVDDLGQAVRRIIRNPGLVRDLLAAYFDRNHDRNVDTAEAEQAIDQIYRQQLEHLLELDPEFTGPIVDVNGNRHIDENERRMLFEQLLAEPEPQDPPERRVSNPLHEGIDRNHDDWLDTGEQWGFMMHVFGTLTVGWLGAPEERAAGGERWPVRSPLDELADLNGDGFVDQIEDRQMAEGLVSPHPVRTPFDRRIDFNSNGEVETFEIVKARRAGERIEWEEEGVYSVRTIMDDHLDLSGDGQVDELEIDRILRFLGGETEVLDRRSKLYRLFDINDDGKISEAELVKGIDLYLLPRPVNPEKPFDNQQDRDRDDFVDPGEIGIAAGVSARGDIPTIPERLERMEWEVAQRSEATVEEEQQRRERYESEFYKKLGQIQDQKLAVVGITSRTKNIDEETASGVMVFIENAFVNVGKVRVVDRENIAKIVKEFEFQGSDLTDESTAVEIGKLSGADIIVIGSISYVGEIFYLNIKLISVETAEIIGSSIADAVNAKEFYEMCNDAVFKLF